MCTSPGNLEDKTVPTQVKALKDHKIVGVSCGSGDSHTIALEDNGRVGNSVRIHLHLHMYMEIHVHSILAERRERKRTLH